MKRELALPVLFLIGILMFAAHGESSRINTCTTEGIDISTVNTYPEWTQTDWKGTPDHAAGGDFMCHENMVYRANWWTSSIPGSADAWTSVCTGTCTGGGSSSGGSSSGGSGEYGPVMSQKTVDGHETERTDTPLFKLIKKSIQTRDNKVVEAIAPGLASNPENVQRVESFIDEANWEYLFPMRHPSYNYTNFLKAIGKFKGFCTTFTDGRDSDTICRKSLATMFAHFTQETGGHDPSSSIPQWRQGLVYVREMGCTEGGTDCGYNAECDPSTWQGKAWPCGKNADGSYKQYFGRGAKQLSYNYNYGPFSQALFGDIRVLLDDPAKVADTWLNLASAVFFFMSPQPPKPSMQHVIDGTWQPNAHDQSLNLTAGFGVTTNIINGGIECGHGTEKQQSLNRMAYYKKYAAKLGVPVPSGEQLGCANQGKFDTKGAGAMFIAWDQDWAYYPDRPEGKAWACKLAGYQTAYSALIEGDYEKCIIKHFGVKITP